MASIGVVQRKGSALSYIVSFSREDGVKSSRTFRDRKEAEAFADQHGGWGRRRTGPAPRPLGERLRERVDKRGPDECWPWIGAANREGGYGYLSTGGRGGRKVYAHRVAWELANGRPVPDGMVVRHSCDNPPCCNPAHLSIGTMLDNANDMLTRHGHYMANRTHCSNGHEFSPENTRVSPSREGRTRRVCRECERSR